MKSIDRRHFLKTSGTLAAAAVLPGFVSAETAKKETYMLRKQKISVNDDWDVIVIGGGPAGCSAAIASAREGSKTLLIEALGQLGGLGTAGMVPAWCPFSDGEKIIYRGLAEKIFRESKKAVPHEPEDKLDWVSINPEYLMSVYDNMVTAAGVNVLFFSQVAAVEMDSNDVVDALIVSNKAGLTAYKAKVYIDCTGDGDVAAWAGANYFKGDNQGELQKSTLCFSLANVDTYNYITGPNLHHANTNSASIQAAKTGRYPLLDTHCCSNLVGPDVVQFNANHIKIADTTDPKQLSDAMLTGRRMAMQHLEMLKEFRPETFGSAFIARTAIIPGIRDSRRIEGDYIFTVEDWMARKSFDDEIGRNAYFLDVHKAGYEEVHYGKGESHGIPYRCLTPKGLKNVLVAGRCISTDEHAFGSLRVMPCCLVTGEAAGLAASLATVQSKSDVHKIDIQKLRRRLREEGQYLF